MIDVFEEKQFVCENDEIAVFVWHNVACVRRELPA